MTLARAFVAANVLVAFAAAGSAAAQAPVDPRFQPWLGCWTPAAPVAASGATAKPPSLACVVPSDRIRGSVDLVVYDSANVATRSSVPLPGTRLAKSVDGCVGTETSTWMPDERRLLMSAELACGRGAVRRETGLMTMSASGDWMQVQHLDVGGNAATTVMTLRYVADSLGEWARLGASAVASTASLRLAVGAPMSSRDVLAVARLAPAPLTEAWLTETGQRFGLNGTELLHLADGGMPPRVLDLMVAMDHPEVFAVRTAGEDRRTGAPDVLTGGVASARMRGACGTLDDFCYGPGGMGAWGLGWQYGLNAYDPWSLRYGVGGMYNAYGYGFGNGFRNGYYFGNSPIIIVDRGGAVPGGTPAVTSGRAVRGAGYTRGSAGGSTSPRDVAPLPPRNTGSSGSGTGSSAGVGSSSGSGSSSSGGEGGTGRTAKPRGGGPL
jgi:hypothetical protein